LGLPMHRRVSPPPVISSETPLTYEIEYVHFKRKQRHFWFKTGKEKKEKLDQ